MQNHSLGPDLSESPFMRHHAVSATLQHVLGQRPSGTALEFGVGKGTTIRMIAEVMPVIRFDSFQGLPEDWRWGYDAGMFACEPPAIPGVTLVAGLFADTLPGFDWPDEIGLVHLDADLYSSTSLALEHVGPRLRPGCYVVFDEYHNYPGHEQHEMRAWREFAEQTGIGWTVVGHGPEQWAIRIS